MPVAKSNLNNDHKDHGILDGLHPDAVDYEEYHYDVVDDDDNEKEQDQISNLQLSEADRKMAEILNSLPMITTKAPKRL